MFFVPFFLASYTQIKLTLITFVLKSRGLCAQDLFCFLSFFVGSFVSFTWFLLSITGLFCFFGSATKSEGSLLCWSQLRQQLQRERERRGVGGGKKRNVKQEGKERWRARKKKKRRCWQSERRGDERKREWAAGDAFSADAQRTAGLLCTRFCPCLISIARMMHAHAHCAGVTTHTHTQKAERPDFFRASSLCLLWMRL